MTLYSDQCPSSTQQSSARDVPVQGTVARAGDRGVEEVRHEVRLLGIVRRADQASALAEVRQDNGGEDNASERHLRTC